MELWEEQFFMDALKLEKLYRSCVREAADGYGLTPNEVAVLLFLSRHAPQQDTATDIASACGISKALVARSVDGLHRRGFLKGERDENDRRLIHLHLCGEGGMLAEQLKQKGRSVARQLQKGVSDEELQAVHSIMRKMQRNLDGMLEHMEGQVK
nr:MarR family transcriptional regulator [uncultured Agathobaculum sp.]